jgi:5-methylcytosine-specific restriction endonuclease McrA
MKFELEKYHRNVSYEELLADLKRVANELAKSPTMDEYNEKGIYHGETLRQRFGSWFTVLEKVGLEKTRTPANVSEEDLFKNIEEVWTKLGRQPRYREMEKPFSRYSAGTYENRFGTWRKALGKFVSYINADKTSEEENISNSSGETISVNSVSGLTIKHKTKREISDRLRFRILMRDGFTCKKCGRSPIKERDIELHVDHIIPWSKGGETIHENLEAKCSRCNLGKGNAFNE